jgi:predicted MFS family arabinose efflux permease
MFVPMGISNGYVVVTLAYLLAAGGVGVDAIALLGVWSLVPQWGKFLVGPLVDSTLTNKTWYLMTTLLTGALIVATGFIPANGGHLQLITLFVFIISVASAFSALAADAVMAHATKPEEKGQAGGWSQAGNLGGSAIGGGLGLWLAQNFSPASIGLPVSAAVVGSFAVGMLCVISCLALFFVHEPSAHHRGERFAQSLVNVGKDVWAMLKSRHGLIAFVAMWLPISAAAMTQLWSAVAPDWHASANSVAMVNGMLGGVINIVGCIAGGWMADRMNRMVAFNASSLLCAVVALVAAFMPRTETSYIAIVSVYMLVAGFCYASWGAVVLEAIGAGAAATKYNVLAGIANGPIMYLSWMDGQAHTVWHAPSWLAVDGTTLMLLTEAFVPVLGTAALVAVWFLTKPFYAKPSAAS